MATNKTTIVTSCYHSCPFFKTSMDGMYCGHPYFDDKKAYTEMIINHDNSHDQVPDKCPLRGGSHTNIIKLTNSIWHILK